MPKSIQGGNPVVVDAKQIKNDYEQLMSKLDNEWASSTSAQRIEALRQGIIFNMKVNRMYLQRQFGKE